MAPTPTPKGYLALVLHAHLPFVRHPEHEQFLEELWLYEAVIETYIPLLEMMEGFDRDGVPWRLTMSLTPPLCSMLNDELLRERCSAHLHRLVDLAESEIARTAALPELQPVARQYRERLAACLHAYEEKHRRDLVGAFRRFAESGSLELIGCSATHAFLPLMQDHPAAVEAQVAMGAAQYEADFGRKPRGVWNAECGYFPGLEQVLARHGVGFFFADTHAVLLGDRKPKYGVFAPVRTPNGVAVFGRDQESSRSVWSTRDGYPGDGRYREFYRDIGYDLEEDYLREHLGDRGVRHATGIKYHRITGPVGLHEKAAYDPAAAAAAAHEHAGHFVFARQQQVLHLASLMDRPPLITSPYDAELFGHWWHEGPQFLDALVRRIARDPWDLALTTPSEYLARHGDLQECTPALSSWGQGGFAEVWLEGSNDWIYRHLDAAAARMAQMARAHAAPDPATRRALDQAARELLLAQSSDWAFIMKTGTTVEYARRRTQEHLNHFLEIAEQIRSGTVDQGYIGELELHHNLFPEIDYRLYAR